MLLSELQTALQCAKEKLHPGADPEVVFQVGMGRFVSEVHNFDSVQIQMNPFDGNDEGSVMIVQE